MILYQQNWHHLHFNHMYRCHHSVLIAILWDIKELTVLFTIAISIYIAMASCLFKIIVFRVSTYICSDNYGPFAYRIR